MFLSSDGSQHIIWYKNIHVWLKQWEAFGVKIEMQQIFLGKSFGVNDFGIACKNP